MANRIEQPTLFPMVDDTRAAGERSAAKRYEEPSLLDAIREAGPRRVEDTAGSARAKYEAFLATIDNSIADRDQNGSTLAELVGGSAEQNANDTMVERGRDVWPVNDPEYWAVALETARFMLDDWRNNYPELRGRKRHGYDLEGEPLTGLLDYERLIFAARDYVPAEVRVDMCRHERVSETYWLFRADPEARSGELQVGAVNRDGIEGKPWIASRMRYGGPVARQVFAELEDALRFAASGKREE